MPSESKSQTKPGSARARRHRRRWLIVIPAAASILGIVGLGLWRYEPVRALSYGQFTLELTKGRVQSAQVGATEITGELKESGKLVRFRASRVGLEHDAQLPALLFKHLPGAAYDAETGPGVFQTFVLPALILGLAAVALVLVVRRSGLGSALAFARSRHRTYDREKFRVTFEDVAGIDEAVAELREVVEFLRTPQKYQALGGRIPKGILLVGPPGTGKTLLAKAVAGEAGVPFFSLSGADFMELFVGVGAARVRNLFAQAEEQAPCLIFIDEIDAIGKARGPSASGAGDERDQTLNQLLVAMDGFDPKSGVIVIAATNRPETLDPALVRPGRFDRNVVVDRPDIGGREKILKVHVRSVPMADEIDLRQIAAMTAGFVGADLANLVNEAALLAARKGKTAVDRSEFEEGVERIIAGPEKRNRVLRPEERRRIAVHEAGHALVARSLPDTDLVHKVTILGRGSGALGYTLYRPEDDRFLHTQSWLLNYICVMLGGTVAEEVVYGEISNGATSDLQRATQIARRMVTEFGMSPKLGRVSYQSEPRSPFLPPGAGDTSAWSPQTAHEIDLEIRRFLDDSHEATMKIVSGRRAALEEIAKALVEKETIDAAELKEILERHPFGA
jgi:cell division protease FtsH